MKPIDKEILRLALPSILANITVPLVGMVDIAVAGHLNASAAALIGGISVGSLMFDMLYWNFGFLRAGTGGMTAQAYGREDWSGCRSLLLRGVGTALLISLAILLIQWPFQKLVFLLVNCSEEVKSLALKYFYIRVWAAPATLSLMAFRGWFIGMQDTFSSMLTDVIVNGVNILASILLALGIPGTGFNGIGFSGIAWGTIIAQYTGLVFATGIVTVKYRQIIRLPAGNASERLSALSGRVNGDLFIRSLCLMVVYLAFTAISARFGDVLLAMCSIMMKLMMIFSFFTDGFAFAGEALTGRFIGMQRSDLLREGVRHTFAWSLGIGLLFVAIYLVSGMGMFRMMTSDTSVIDSAGAFLGWLVLMPLIGCPAFTWDGIFIGATETRILRNSTIGCLVSFLAVWFAGMVFKPQGNALVHLLFAAYYSHLIFRSVYLTFNYRSIRK
ncbi:MAG: MATE family efflux transporter [Bacteroidales bacterium]|nr:MATE family efflux transporter [Bacteroidales bacterium]